MKCYITWSSLQTLSAGTLFPLLNLKEGMTDTQEYNFKSTSFLSRPPLDSRV